MSYCRFRNTLRDFLECQDALNTDGLDALTEEERAAALRLIRKCCEVAEDFGDTVPEECRP